MIVIFCYATSCSAYEQMTAYLSEFLTTYNDRIATLDTRKARKSLFHKVFRASFTLAGL